MTVNIVAFQFGSVESVHGIYQALETCSKVRYVEYPAEKKWGIHVSNAETEDGEKYHNYRTDKYCDL